MYVGELPSTKLLGTFILFFGHGSLSCVIIGQNAIFSDFHAFWDFLKVKLFILPPFFIVGQFT